MIIEIDGKQVEVPDGTTTEQIKKTFGGGKGFINAPKPLSGPEVFDLAAKQTAGAAKGIGKATESGFERFLRGLAGLPGDIAAGAAAGGVYDPSIPGTPQEKHAAGLPQQAAQEVSNLPIDPTSSGTMARTIGGLPSMVAQQFAKAATYDPSIPGTPQEKQAAGLPEAAAAEVRQAVPGQDYVPQNRPEQYAQTFGEFAPNMLTGGGGAIPRFARAAVPAAISETAGQIAHEVAPQYEAPARLLGGIGGSLIAAHPAISSRGPQTAQSVIESERAARAAEQGIPLSRGQVTRNPIDVAFEQEALHGVRGGGARTRMQAFEDAQVRARQEAEGRISQQLGGETQPAEAGSTTQTALRERAEGLQASGEQAYEDMAARNARIATPAVQTLPDRLTAALERQGIHIDPNLGGYEGTRQALNLIDRVVPSARNTPPGTSIAAVSLQELNEARKAIGRATPSGASDATALGHVRREFNTFLDDAVQNALYSGDPAALDDLRRATDYWRQSRDITKPRGEQGRPPDISQRVVADIVNKQRSPEVVANWLLNYSSVQNADQAARVVRQIRSALAESNPEVFEQIRQAAWQKALQPQRGQGGPQALSSEINRFISGPGAPLARELMSDTEIRAMRGLQRTIADMVPAPRGTQPSKSGYTNVRSFMSNLPVIGALAHGKVGALIGAGAKMVGDIGGTIKAGRATGGGTGYTPTPQFERSPSAGVGLAAPLLSLQNQLYPAPRRDQ